MSWRNSPNDEHSLADLYRSNERTHGATYRMIDDIYFESPADLNKSLKIDSDNAYALRSPASIIDYSYSSVQDLYDAILNTLFPIIFVILFNVRGETGRIKKVVLPLIDDILYNIITWLIPLIVAFTYGDTLYIKIFSIINMCLHVFCAVFAIIKHETIKGSKGKTYSEYIFWFLVFFPVIVIPMFWIITIILYIYGLLDLFAPCVFILVLSSTRNMSYYTDKVPDDFLATSTAITQYMLRDVLAPDNFMKPEGSAR
ncbi:15089_t:CDS:2 [Cetraspora pellucida]|uniref:15089_t:CDS:1 n=1 Tax=Cetraspora pellucida TaxID=1433469 RepID=A0A9N9NY03_9GLOM|nr:15089_t:CDS:2 [Cetraspora pellucida]